MFATPTVAAGAAGAAGAGWFSVFWVFRISTFPISTFLDFHFSGFPLPALSGSFWVSS
jgi:hypothetical protein